MTGTAGTQMKLRLRDDLKSAMKDRQMGEVKLIRALVAAIDQAEAPPAETGSYVQHDFSQGSAETQRLDLAADDVRAIVEQDAVEREQAADELERAGMADKAQALREEALFVRRYLA